MSKVLEKIDAFFEKIRNTFYLRTLPDRGKDIHRLWGSLAVMHIWFDLHRCLGKYRFFRIYVESLVVPAQILLDLLLLLSYFVVYAIFVKVFGEGIFKIARTAAQPAKRPLNERSKGKRVRLFCVTMFVGAIPMFYIDPLLNTFLKEHGLELKATLMFPAVFIAWSYDVFWHQKKYPITAK